jgi:hypothetical protein
VISDEESILVLLRELQHGVLAHSEAARALFAALVREGRLFAQTGEGQRWQERIQRSALLERALLVWQAASAWMTEDTGAATPSALVDALAAAARSPDRDLLLERLFAGEDR